MGQSFREYITALGRWGFVILADLFFAATGAYLDITGEGPIPAWVWVPGLLGGLVVAPFVAFHRVRVDRDEARRVLHEVSDDRPSVDVALVNERFGGEMFLELTNLGERGEFEAQIEMLEGCDFIHGLDRPPLPVYTGYWERSAAPKAGLPQGHKDRLMIGKREFARGGLLSAEFQMYFYDAARATPRQYGTISWVPMSGHSTIAARFLLRITISSTPRMAKGPFIRTYLVDGRGNPPLQELPSSA